MFGVPSNGTLKLASKPTFDTVNTPTWTAGRFSKYDALIPLGVTRAHDGDQYSRLRHTETLGTAAAVGAGWPSRPVPWHRTHAQAQSATL